MRIPHASHRVLVTVVIGSLLGVPTAWASTVSFAPPFTIGHSDQGGEQSGPTSLTTASNGLGDIAIGWTNTLARGSQSLELALRRVGGGLSRGRTIVTSKGAVSQSSLAMDRSGATLVVYTRYRHHGRQRSVMALEISAGGHVGRDHQISPAGARCEAASVAGTSDGAAIVVFQCDARIEGGGQAVSDDVMAVSKAPGGRFGAATVISPRDLPAGATGDGGLDPTVAVDAAGAAVAAWNREVTPGTISTNASGVVQAASAPAGGTFAAPVTLGTSVVDEPVTLAINASGDTLATWTNARYAFVAAQRAAGTTGFSAPTTLSNGNLDGSGQLNGTAAIVSPTGPGRVLWTYGGSGQGGRLATASWAPGTAITPGPSVIAAPTIGPHGSFAPYTGTPSIVTLRERELVLWQESALQTNGRDGSGNNSRVTLEDAITSPAGAFGAGRRALPHSLGAADGLLPAVTLAGGGSGRVYLTYVSDDGTVRASRLTIVR